MIWILILLCVVIAFIGAVPPAVADKPGGQLARIYKEAETKSARFNTLMDGGNDLTAEETAEAAELSASLKALKTTYRSLAEGADAANEFKKLLSDPESPFAFGGKSKADQVAEIEDGKIKNIKGFDKKQLEAISTKSYNDSYYEYLAKGIHGMSEGARKALSEGADAGGGFLVPEQIQQMLVSKKPTPTRVASQVRHWTTGRDHLTFPKNVWGTDDIYTSPIRLTQTGEIPASSTTAQQTDPTFGEARIQIYTHMVNGQITRDMLEDAMFDMQEYLVEKYNEAKDILMDLKVLSGTGIGTVTGILANPGSTVGGQTQPAVVNMGDPFTGDGFINLAYAVPEQYDEDCRYFLNKVNCLRKVALLKDSSGRYLFGTGSYGDGPGIATARPKELVGYPYVLSGLMPDPATNAYPVIFGDPSGYYLVERVGLSIQVLDQTKAKENQIELVGRLRFGGQTVEDWKLKVGKQA